MATSGPGKSRNPLRFPREPQKNFEKRFNMLLEEIRKENSAIQILDFSDVGDLLTKEMLKELSNAIYAKDNILKINLKNVKLTVDDLAQFRVELNKNLQSFAWDMPDIPNKGKVQKIWPQMKDLSDKFSDSLRERQYGADPKKRKEDIKRSKELFKNYFAGLTEDKLRKKITDIKAKEIRSRDQSKHLQHQALLALLIEVEKIINTPGGFEAVQYYFNNKEEADIIFGFKDKTDKIEREYKEKLSRDFESKVEAEVARRVMNEPASDVLKQELAEGWGIKEDEDEKEVKEEVEEKRRREHRVVENVSNEAMPLRRTTRSLSAFAREFESEAVTLASNFQLANAGEVLKLLPANKQDEFMHWIEGLSPDQISILQQVNTSKVIEFVPDNKKLQVVQFIANLTRDQVNKFEASQFSQILMNGPDKLRNTVLRVAESLPFDRIENSLRSIDHDFKARMEALSKLESGVLEARAAQEFRTRQTHNARMEQQQNTQKPRKTFVYNKDVVRVESDLNESLTRSREHAYMAVKYVLENLFFAMRKLDEQRNKLTKFQFLHRAALNNDINYLDAANTELRVLRTELEDKSKPSRSLEYLQRALKILKETRSKVQDGGLLAALDSNINQINVVMQDMRAPKPTEPKSGPNSP